MQQRNLYSIQTLGHENHSACGATSAWPVPLPELRIEKKWRWLKACHSLIVVMLFIALTGLVFGVCYLYHLQQQLNQLKQNIDGSLQKNPEKLTGAEDKTKPKNDVQMAAHLTGKRSTDDSNRLKWETSLGHAFILGITYKDGALIINETGQYFIYSKINFRGSQCEVLPLHQSVFKCHNNDQNDVKLMEIRVFNYCSGVEAWEKNTFQAGIFHLREGAQLYVSVPNPRMVSADELMTFFGVYKL
ncbi:tumor necrosis factor ligand superfamily member 6-like [Heptranchias perlo]|uniref:tumor necrosis factor ligand superfamily member 6-like n=1 Tax=Heptranchias perlo TaxID=212740 RepID=UPI00355A3CFD